MKWLSRKFVALIAETLLIAFAVPDALSKIVLGAVGAVYIAIQGLIDWAAKKREPLG